MIKHVHQAIQEGDVAAHPEAHVGQGKVGQGGAPGIHQDQLGPVVHRVFHEGGGHRVSLGHVGADDTKNILALSKSAKLLVMAPEPKEVARPATVGACQVRAQ